VEDGGWEKRTREMDCAGEVRRRGRDAPGWHGQTPFARAEWEKDTDSLGARRGCLKAKDTGKQ